MFMIFKVTPKKFLHGKKLKVFYRMAAHIANPHVRYNGGLPKDWYNRPAVYLTRDQLDEFMDSLVRRGHP